jgi:hypothetical protein
MIKKIENAFTDYIKNRISESNFSSEFSPDNLVHIYYQKLRPFNDFRNAQLVNLFVKEGQYVNKGNILAEITFGGSLIGIFAENSGIIHIVQSVGSNLSIGDCLFIIYFENNSCISDLIEWRKFSSKIIYNLTTLKYFILFFCFHILITFGVFLLPYTIRGIAFIIYFLTNIFISFFLVLIIKYFNAFPHEQKYIGDHAIDNTNFVVRSLVLAFFITLFYFGFEIAILDFFEVNYRHD